MKSDTKITRFLSAAAMAATMVSPAVAMAGTNTSTLENPSGGDPILVEHPLDTAQSSGQNNIYGDGAYQGAGAAKENSVSGTDAFVKVHESSEDASFDTVMGHGAGVTGSAGTAIGAAANVDSQFGGTAVGVAANAENGQMGTAVGYMSEAEGNFATAEGANSKAVENATALGANAKAEGENSVALGHGSVADEKDTVSVGKKDSERRITNVKEGVNDTDAVNVSQLKKGLDGKANTDLSNITKEGEEVIRNLSKGGDKVDITSNNGSIVVNKETKEGQVSFDLKLAEDQTFNHVTSNTVDAKTVNTTELNANMARIKNLNVTGDTVIGFSEGDTLDVKATTVFENAVTVDGTATFNGDVEFNKKVNFNDGLDAKYIAVNGDTYISEDGIDAHNHKVINVADGTIAEGSKDAVNGGQLFTAMNDVRKGVKDDIDQATGEVGAQAAAMSALHPLEYDSDSKVSVSTSVGAYKDKVAGAVGAFYRPSSNSMISAQGSFGHNNNMYAIGYSQKFGHNNKEAKNPDEVSAALADLQQKYDKLLGMLSNKADLPQGVVGNIVVAPGNGSMTSRAMAMLKEHDDALDALHDNCNPNPNPNIRHYGFRRAGN